MKRAASDLEDNTTEGTQPAQPVQHTRPSKRKDCNLNEDGHMSLANYHKEKVQAMGKGFDDKGEPTKQRPEPLDLEKVKGHPRKRKHPGFAAQTYNRQDTFKRPSHPERSTVTPPLPGDSIASILQQTKPDCVKAQAWMMAHEISKKTRESTKKNQKPPANNNKKVQDKVTRTARRTVLPSSSSAEEPDEPPEARVKQASDRLQEMMLAE